MKIVRQKHAYSDRLAFERLLLLIAIFLKFPGIGYQDPLDSESAAVDTKGDRSPNPESEQTAQHHDALLVVQQKLADLATQMHLNLPGFAIPTLRKDLHILRKYGILADRKFRWGYYLGTGALQQEELETALQALYSQAKYQQDPKINQISKRIARRLRNMEWGQGKKFYPTRVQINRVITHTDPEEMIAKGKYSQNLNLYHEIAKVERAIGRGECIRVVRYRDPYQTAKVGSLTIYPLQLIYHDIAWYLLFEEAESGLLAIERVDRFTDDCQIIEDQSRSSQLQQQQLDIAHKLLKQGWGLYLGKLEEQTQELKGKLELTKVTVQFFPKVAPFIMEGDRRHPSQKIEKVKDPGDGKLRYVEYTVHLPPRSLSEFSRWVHRFMQDAIIVEPKEMSDQQYESAKVLCDRLKSLPTNSDAHKDSTAS
jgi:hypothetical protein